MIYTMTAAQGANSAELINAGMAKKLVGKIVQRRVVVAAPDGPSTGGGKHARQVITLTALDATKGAPVMCGWLDVTQKAAGLRDYRTVSEQYRSRHAKPIDITGEEYLRVVRDLEGMLKALSISATHEVAEPVKKAAQVAKAMVEPEPEREEPKPLMLGIAGALMVIAAVVFVLLLLR